jgi:hypothetical protein
MLSFSAYIDFFASLIQQDSAGFVGWRTAGKSARPKEATCHGSDHQLRPKGRSRR